ncbi:MAG: arylsulfatase [Opitutus sp.]|nr:arylsulfatase [Opitutus sp.]
MLRSSVLALIFLFAPVVGRAAGNARPPNIVFILTDDQGYGDVGCFGAKNIKTPHLDRMAREGMRFTNFYVSEAVCTASRASILTGSYAIRVGLQGALNHTSALGLSSAETTLPTLLKGRGYRTALFGKWHLGHHAQFNPLRHGFDEFVGTMFPNDCSNEFHPIIRTFPPFTIYEGEKAIAQDPDQSIFTAMLTKRSVEFIGQNKDRPFFLYLAHVMPHVPIHPSEKFRGQSQGGKYGDTIEELDWSVGEILAAVKANGLDDNTLIIFTSDNGPFLSYGTDAGSAGPMRGGKLTAFEGGVHMPCIMRWPGKIPAGRDCHEIAATIDLLPTFTRLAGAGAPARPIDGRDILPLMTGQPGAKSPHEAYYYYNGTELHAVRSGAWKLHFPHPYLVLAAAPGKNGKPSNFENLKPDSIKDSSLAGIASRHGYKVEQGGLELYNLDSDIGESKNVADQYPDVVKRLLAFGQQIRPELGDSLTGQKGAGVRLPGKFE